MASLEVDGKRGIDALSPEQKKFRTTRQATTGGAVDFAGGSESGTELAISPDLLLSWGPVMLKVGRQIPVSDTFDDPEVSPDYWR
jgi:hypothetical protein